MFRCLKNLEAREVRVIEDDRHTGYGPGQDVTAEKDGVQKQDFQEGMLARLSRFDNSQAGKITVLLCWIGMIGAAIAALNLVLERPWF